MSLTHSLMSETVLIMAYFCHHCLFQCWKQARFKRRLMLNGLNLRVICSNKSFNLQLFGITFLYFMHCVRNTRLDIKRLLSFSLLLLRKRLKLTSSSPKYPVFVLILSLIRMGIESHAKCGRAWGQRDSVLRSKEIKKRGSPYSQPVKWNVQK